MRKIIGILWGLWLGLELAAQSPAMVVGQVMDEKTGQPIANVNISVQGTNYGTTSNSEGLFFLKAPIDRRRTMVVSCVGYESQRFSLDPGQQGGVDVMLKEKVSHMTDIVVMPGVNPAIPLMERVRAMRAMNDKSRPNDEAQITTHLYVSDISSKHLQRQLWKTLQAGMLPKGDSTYLLPLYTATSYAGKLQERAVMMDATNYRSLLDGLQNKANFYHNTVEVLSASALSPLAASSSTYYQFYLVDSSFVEGKKQYTIHFRTRNEYYTTFNGEMEIDSASCALIRIQATIPAHNSINYLHDFRIRQHFAPDGTLLDEQTSMILDVAVKQDSSKTFPTLLLTRQVTYPVAATHPVMPTLNRLDSTAFAASDSSTFLNLVKYVAYTLQTGYLSTNTPVEIGKLSEVLHTNQTEGVRLGVPLRTTRALWENVCLEGFVAYGTKDRAVKGAGEVHLNLPGTNRHQIHLRYGDEYVYSDVNEYTKLLRENTKRYVQSDWLTAWMQVTSKQSPYNYNLHTRRREGKVLFEDEWNEWLESSSYLKLGRMGYGEPTSDYNAQSSYFYTTIGSILRFSFEERKLDLYFHRKHLYNNYPVIFVGAEMGSYRLDPMASYRMFGTVNVTLRQKVNLGMAGELNYALQAGMVLGKVPYTLLQIMPANQTVTFDAYRFSLMNNYQYAADRYLMLHTHWNGQGILFNLIPGVRRLKLRELAEMKLAWGSIAQNHEDITPFPHAAYTIQELKIPYVEVGVGIGNIFRVGELYGIFRVTHINDPACPYWAIRFRLHIGM